MQNKQRLNSAQSNGFMRYTSQGRVNKPKEKEKPDWNERFFLEHIPDIITKKGQGKTKDEQQKRKGLKGTRKFQAVRTGTAKGFMRQRQEYDQQEANYSQISVDNQENKRIFKSRPKSNYMQKRDAEDNKYSNNPLVSHYINMQEKPAVANLEDPAILNGYLEQLQKDINYEWQAKGIPHFHRKNFASAMKGLPKIDIVSFVFRELKQLKRERAQIQICIKVVRAREACLEAVKQFVEKLRNVQNGSEEQRELLNDISESLKDLRLLSLESVEQVLRWRESLQQYEYKKGGVEGVQFMSNQLPFYLNGRNYLLKMRDDIKFLKETQLQFHVNLSVATVSDPFLLTMQKQQIITDPLYVDALQVTQDCTLLLQRIRASELIIFEESIQRRAKEQFGDYQVKPFKLQESGVQSFLSSYFDTVSLDIKNQFHSGQLESLLQLIETEQEVNFLKIESAGSQNEPFQGLGVISVDGQQYSDRRINILHVSCREKSFYNSILNTLVDYLWKNDTADEIRVNLFYNENNGKLQLDPYVKNIFGSIGFKWRQLVNDPTTGKRSTIFGLKRPQAILAPPKSNKQEEPIVLSALVMISEKSGFSSKHSLQSKNYEVPLLLAMASKKLINVESFQKVISQYPSLTNLKEKKFIDIQDVQVKGAECKVIQNNQQLNEYSQRVFPDLNFNLSDEGQTVACIAKSIFRWNQFSFGELEGKKYLRIKKRVQENEDTQISKFYSQSDTSHNPLILVPTDDSSASIFYFNPSSEQLQRIKAGNGVGKIMAEVIQKCDQKEQLQVDLWVPNSSFCLDLHSIPQAIQGTIKLAECKIEFSTAFNSQIEGGIIPNEPTPETGLVIKPPFIFGNNQIKVESNQIVQKKD